MTRRAFAFLPIVLLSLLVGSALSAASEAARAVPGAARPLLLWIESDPWAMVLGADTPRVVIYEDGEAIFVKRVGETATYHHVRLDSAALAAIGERLRPVFAVREVRGYYDLAPNVTDQPDAMFYLRSGERELATQVRGLMAPQTRLPAYTRFGGGTPPDEVPAPLLRLHEWLASFDAERSTEWTPERVEVMLWDYSYAPEASIAWPKDWPSLASSRARKRGASSYSIFLDGSELPRLRAFLATRNDRGAVEIEGHKMAIAFRYVFPGAETWSRAFQAAMRREQARSPR